MAYTPPATGGLNIAVNGINIGIWMDTTLEGALGDNFIAARLDPNSGWTAFW